MCGIAGLMQLQTDTRSQLQVQAMLRATRHRGPDGQAMVVLPNAVLGHNRLAIVDLSDQAAQPMQYQSLTLVYNGEVYNYLELRRELEQKGYHFSTQSDTEVLLKAFHCWGEACLQKLHGMWAFALHDAATGRLFLCRDRFGEKPLYYTVQDGWLLFCSEIKGLLAAGVPAKAHRGMVAAFFIHEQAEHPELTFFENMLKLPPGHMAWYKAGEAAVVPQRYYQPPMQFEFQDGPLVEEFAQKMASSVRWRLRSDVPVGTCLSGGLDSSFIAATAALLHPVGFHAITAGHSQPGTDERPFARMVAAHCGLHGHEVLLSAEDVKNMLPEVVRAQEEPFGSLSVVMQYAVMQAAAALGLKVMLDGQGADEILLGYTHHLASLHQLQRFPNKQNSWQEVQQHQQLTMAQVTKLRYYDGQTKWQNLRRNWRWHQMKRECLNHAEAAMIPPPPKDLSAWMSYQLTHYTLPALLRYEDKNAMHFGVETRLPYLDHELVAWCLGLPLEQKWNHGWSKYLLRKALDPLVPAAIAWRKGKIGFTAPEAAWLDALPASTCQNNNLLQSMFRHGQVPRLLGNHRWRLYSVALWSEAFDVS